VGEVIEQIIARDGVCEAKALVAEAENPTSPIHGVFDPNVWDDEFAAQRYREEQARKVIASIRVVVDGIDAQPPAFVSIRVAKDEEGSTGYQETLKVMVDPAGREAVLADALSELTALEHRYDSLTALAPVWKALGRIRAVK
jgi:hypothetical protein